MSAGSLPRPPVGVLALQGDFREHLAILTECGADARPVRRPEELVGLAGLVLPGGESTTIDRLSRIFEVRDPLVAAIGNGLPVYGSCAGMIMLADRILDGHAAQQTFGGLDATVRRNAFGRQIDSYETDLVIDELGELPIRAVFIRAPWVEEAGPDVRVLAAVTVDGVDRPVAVAQDVLLATAFHPEVAGEQRLHERFLRTVRSA